MTYDVEEVVRRGLDTASADVSPRPAWTTSVLAGLERQHTVVRRRQLLMAAAATALIATVIVLVSGRDAGRAQPAPEPDPPAGQRMVDIGGRKLSLECSGASSSNRPTVILETGLGGQAATYDQVKSLLTDDLRLCTYDHAGTGESDAADVFPRTARSLADDLARLVDAAGLGPSVVLVTDGFTGMSGAVFAADHPELVTGLVFLDPRGPHVSLTEAEALGRRTRGEPRLLTELRGAYETDSLSRNGEQISYPDSETEAAAVLDAPGPAFGAIPTVVLTSQLARAALPPLPAPIRGAWWQAWRADQEQLAHESTRGVLREVARQSGSLAASAPADVASAIREVARLEL